MGRGRRGSNKRGNFKNHGSRKKPNQAHGSGKFKNKRSFNKDGDDKRDGTSENKRQKLEPVTEPIDEESSSSDSEEEVKPYIQLLSMFKSSSKAQQVLTSDEEESEETDDEEIPDDKPDSGSGENDDSDIEEEQIDEEDEDSLGSEEGNVIEEEEEEEEEGSIQPEEDEANDSKEDLSGSEGDEEELSSTDPFCLHFEREMSENLLETLTSPKPYEAQELKWKALGRMVVHLPCKVENKTEKPKPILGEAIEKFVIPGTLPVLKHGIPLKDYGVKLQLCTNLDKRALSDGAQLAEELFSPLQHELFTLANEYRDVYYPEQSHMNSDEIRTVYCLHSLNHVLKSRDKVLYHNTKLKKARENGAVAGEIEYRDQGLVRPRVLIIAPLRNSAVKIVEKLASLLLPKKGQIINNQRFYDEFGEEKDEESKKEQESKKSYKPEDFEAIFTGNTDDSFRLGISVAKRTLKLYAGFYVADILIASPLGARTLLAEDFDFLSSIEVLIIDQTDILYMQNWDHVLHIFQHLHLQPREQHETDLGRVRLWALNGYSPHYRQNLIFSSVALPEASALFSRRGTNFAGKIRVENLVSPSSTTVCRVVVQLPQAFHRFPATVSAQSADERFHFFIKKILPQYRDPLMSNTLIYIPSYYDYVRLRNHLHKEDYNFGQACEYTPDGKLAQVRNRFFIGKKRLLLYTERLHFYRRLTMKGIHHIVFYQLPTYPHFYPELCNLLQDAFQSKKYRGDSTQTCTVLYSTFDAPRLSGIVGSQRAAEMLTSDRNVHLFVSGGS